MEYFPYRRVRSQVIDSWLSEPWNAYNYQTGWPQQVGCPKYWESRLGNNTVPGDQIPSAPWRGNDQGTLENYYLYNQNNISFLSEEILPPPPGMRFLMTAQIEEDHAWEDGYQVVLWANEFGGGVNCRYNLDGIYIYTELLPAYPLFISVLPIFAPLFALLPALGLLPILGTMNSATGSSSASTNTGRRRRVS